MPPDVRDWLPEGHLAWFVLDAVEEMDLSAFYAGYRADGHGRAAYEPSMMVALLLYAYARGMRSSRAIERACEEDVAYRVIAAQQRARSRDDRAVRASATRTALADLFGAVLELCAEAGLARSGWSRSMGPRFTRTRAATRSSTTSRSPARSLRRRSVTDAAEDELYGEARGDELPPELRDEQGRRGWLRDAQRRLDERARRGGEADPASRPQRLKESKRRLEEELWSECQANASLRGLPGARGDEGRPAVRRPTQALRAAGDAGGAEINVDRSGLAASEGRCAAGCRATTPRPCQRGPDRLRRRGDGRFAGLRASRADAQRRPDRTRRRRRHRHDPRRCSRTPATGTSSKWSAIVAGGTTS